MTGSYNAVIVPSPFSTPVSLLPVRPVRLQARRTIKVTWQELYSPNVLHVHKTDWILQCSSNHVIISKCPSHAATWVAVTTWQSRSLTCGREPWFFAASRIGAGLQCYYSLLHSCTYCTRLLHHLRFYPVIRWMERIDTSEKLLLPGWDILQEKYLSAWQLRQRCLPCGPISICLNNKCFVIQYFHYSNSRWSCATGCHSVSKQ